MKISATLRHFAGATTITLALGALAAACGSSSTSAASLVARARSQIQAAKTYVVDLSIASPGTSLAEHARAEVDAPSDTALVTTQLGGLTLREYFAPPRLYLELPRITPTATASSTWYSLPSSSFSSSSLASSTKVGQVLSSVFHARLDGHVVVSGTSCNLVVASAPLASVEQSLGFKSQTPGVHPAGNIEVEVAISPAGYPLRIVEHLDQGQLHEIVTESFSDFGAPLHIAPPPPSEIKKISLSQLGGLLSGLPQ